MEAHMEEATIVSGVSLSDLTAKYDSIKNTASKVTSKLASANTLNGMDNVNKIVSDAMKQIQILTQNGKKPSVRSRFGSKALAVIDPKNKWAGKWLDNAKDELAEETLKEKTMEEIANEVISSINTQREDVISYMESIVEVRSSMIQSRDLYEELLKEANDLLPTIDVDTRDELDTKSLINRLNKSLMQVDSTISTKINPLVASARIAVSEIDAQLPDIEHDLKYEGSLKVAQQSLSDLIGMAKTVKNMTEQAGDVIREDIHATTLESIAMVGDVMVDTDRMKRLQKEEEAHMIKVSNAMGATTDKINKNFTELNQIQLEYREAKEKNTHLLIEAH